ncbi:MAG: hypothetical protein KL863_15185 [Rhizobium sp.]|nr:hypothetical protein [Rhizobium sp.]
MMVEARKDDDERPVADNAAADLSRFAEASSKLLAEQAAAFAVMTAYGLSVTAQMTGMMLGALRGPASAEKMAEEPAAPQSPSAKIVPLHPRAAAPDPAASLKAEVAEKPVRTSAAKSKAKVAAPAVVAPKPKKPARDAVAGRASGKGDDLKKISGIGPRLEKELNARGIHTYGDIATLGEAAVMKLDEDLGLEGRIARDDWAGQAKALSGGKS